MASRAANILDGTRQALAIAEGEADPASYKIHVPAEVDVRAIRMGLSRMAEQVDRTLCLAKGTYVHLLGSQEQ
ncbi:hypothetical protein P7D22_20010 [Lichenihabitans sp. Uapishka_5]|uniref:hypothetical protein n=1 Tax=Lichenihabitans sp. Uapishka_5 TaxID=3037302 RepID=UPI0029E80051|nr:hypothetical protein [Lichenihabitans sp. Uapishka_5]MDX7953454.1 hypothetical protein [Lichenihabitans sp. Uapishka_5]